MVKRRHGVRSTDRVDVRQEYFREWVDTVEVVHVAFGGRHRSGVLRRIESIRRDQREQQALRGLGLIAAPYKLREIRDVGAFAAGIRGEIIAAI